MLPQTIGASAAQPSVQTKTRNPYVYALDPIRVITALSVLSLHVNGFSVVLNSSTLGYEIQLGAGSALHFTREVFMFTTAFVLVYTYAGADFNLTTFLRRRGITVLVPYVLWSVIYVAFYASMDQVSLPPPQFAITTVKAMLTGNASYQLYFVLLTLQFYALFPLLQRVLPWIRRHARCVLAVSCVLQLVLLSLDFVFVENMHAPPIFPSGWAMRIDFYLHRFVLTYQFYFLLGVVAALHFDRVSVFLLAHGREIVATFVLALGAFWFNFAFSVWVGHNTADYAVAVLQPAMVPYSVVVLAFLGWLACRWAPPPRGGEASTQPRAARSWHTLADATFGIYLVHPLFLTLALAFVAPALPSALSVPLRVVLLLLLVATISVGASVLFLRTPGLSALVGRPSALPTLDALRVARRAVRSRFVAHPADTHPPAQTSGRVFAAQGAVQMPAPARSRATLPLGSSAGMTGPRRPSLAIDVSEDMWSEARGDACGAVSGEENGGWDVVRGQHEAARRSVWTDPNAVRSRGDDADVSIPNGYPPRPFSKQSDRQQRIRRAQQLRQEGWRQRQIAAALGVSRSTISHWLTHSPPHGDGIGARDAEEIGAQDAEDGPPDSAVEEAVLRELRRTVVSSELRAPRIGNKRFGEGA